MIALGIRHFTIMIFVYLQKKTLNGKEKCQRTEVRWHFIFY